MVLGRDARVLVHRKRIDLEEKVKKVTGEKIATMKYQIIAKNLNIASLELNILDHFLLSTQEDIIKEEPNITRTMEC